MAKLLIMGASRGVGLETVKAALSSGHEVRAFARSAASIPVRDERLEKFRGDARNADDVRRALEGMDAVVQTLGADPNLRVLFEGTTLFSEATRILVDAMERNGPKRLVTVTGFGAGDSRDHLGPLFRMAFTVTLRRVYDDKDVQEQIIKASGLDWTIARPGFLRDGRATGLYRALTNPADWKLGSIRRADIARFLLDEIERPQFLRQTPALMS